MCRTVMCWENKHWRCNKRLFYACYKSLSSWHLQIGTITPKQWEEQEIYWAEFSWITCISFSLIGGENLAAFVLFQVSKPNQVGYDPLAPTVRLQMLIMTCIFGCTLYLLSIDMQNLHKISLKYNNILVNSRWHAHVCARDITIEHKVAESLQLSQGNNLFVRALTVSHDDWLMSKIVRGWRAKARESKVFVFSPSTCLTLRKSHPWLNNTTSKLYIKEDQLGDEIDM